MKTKKNPTDKQTDSLQLILGEKANFDGELRFRGSARVGGTLKGSIKGEGLLIIESTAKVLAEVQVDHLVLFGDFKGRVLARKSVLMEPPASFSGEVSSPSLSIKEGVFFEGSSKKTVLS